MARAPSDWTMEAQKASHLAQEITYMLAERDNTSRIGGTTSVDKTQAARSQLKILDRMLDGLDTQMREQQSRLNRVELNERRETMRKLRAEREKLRMMERTAPHSSDKDALLGSGKVASYGRETELTRDMTADQMFQRVDTETAEQDKYLDKMDKNLANLKNLGVQIKDEADRHNALLDDADRAMDDAENEVNKATSKVRRFTRDAKTCWLYVTICILLAVLLTLVLVRWH